mgnify:CR=1 FL=1
MAEEKQLNFSKIDKNMEIKTEIEEDDIVFYEVRKAPFSGYGFYDYKNKYQGTTREVCPAEIPDEIAARAAELTKKGFEALRLSDYARFDYLLDGDGALWCLEANSLPGMTPTSLLPQEAKVAGIEYGELCELIIQKSFLKIN